MIHTARVRKWIVAAALFPALASAQDKPLVSSVDDVMKIAKQAVTYLYEFFFIVAVFYIVWAAFLFLRGGDNPKNIEEAKSRLKNAVIAIVVALLATGVSAIIGSFISTAVGK